MEKVKKRDTNIELLRIICIVMIIALHYIQHGGIFEYELQNTTGYHILTVIKIFFLVSVNCFFLITGYYYAKTKFNTKKILLLWGKTILYSVLIYIICLIFDYKHIGGPTEFIQSFFPILTASYWFLTIYIALFFVIPLLNMILNQITKKQLQFVLTFFIVSHGILSFIFTDYKDNIISHFSLAIMMYLLGAYIKQYIPKKKKNFYLPIYITTCLISILGYQIITKIHQNVDMIIINNLWENWFDFTTIFNIISSITLFLFFVNISINKQKINKLIMAVAPSVVSIYMIHENHVSRHWWKELLNTQAYTNTYYIIPHLILCVIGVFLGCLIIDKIRGIITKQILKSKKMQNFNIKIDAFCEKINIIANDKREKIKELESCQEKAQRKVQEKL